MPTSAASTLDSTRRRRRQPLRPRVRRRLLLDVCLFGLICAFCTTSTVDNSSSSTQQQQLQSMHFPTLFYPGPDNKFITESPPPVLPEVITIVVNGRKETFQRPKTKMKLNFKKRPLPLAPPRARMNAPAPEPARVNAPARANKQPPSHPIPATHVDNVLVRPSHVDNVLVRPSHVDEPMEMTSSTHRTPAVHQEEDQLRLRLGHRELPIDLQTIRFNRFRVRHRLREPIESNVFGQRSPRPEMSVFDRYRPPANRPQRPRTFVPNVISEPETKYHTEPQLPYGSTTFEPPMTTAATIPETEDEPSDAERNFRLRTSTSFTCAHLRTGYYGDLEAGCKIFHVCHHGQKHTFECPDQTLFNQQLSVCDWAQRVTCSDPNLSRNRQEHEQEQEQQREHEQEQEQHEHEKEQQEPHY